MPSSTGVCFPGCYMGESWCKKPKRRGNNCCFKLGESKRTRERPPTKGPPFLLKTASWDLARACGGKPAGKLADVA